MILRTTKLRRLYENQHNEYCQQISGLCCGYGGRSKMKNNPNQPPLTDQKFKPAPQGTKRSPLVGLVLLATLLAALLVIGGLGYYWVQDTKRGPVELSYCTNGINYGTPRVQCTEYKILRIPRSYFPLGGHFDYSHHTAGGWEELEVAYPSMQPWHSVPLWEKWKTHKLEVDVKGALAVLDARESLKVYSLGTPKPSHVQSSLYGLDQYLSEPGHDFQYLLPLEPNPRVFIHCGYKDNGDLAYERGFGCSATTSTSWNLPISIRYKRILLPQWADINAKTQALIKSFVVTP
jgi:hypothetical protein